MTHMERLFAALYISEGWYDWWARAGKVHAKARAVVLYDRVLTERIGGDA